VNNLFKEATPQTDEAIPESKASLAKPAKETLYSGFKPRESSFLCELSAFARTLLCFLVQLRNLTQNSRCQSVKHFNGAMQSKAEAVKYMVDPGRASNV
jgi:hypothetical protein